MTTYDSYQEAKIANPESLICKFGDKFTIDSSRFGQALQPCNPADHCMTVEKFLANGHKFVEGDLILDEGSVYLVTDYKTQNYWYETESANEPDCDDGRRYTLRAASLEQKPKRVKVEYVKCEFSREWEAVKYYNEEGELFVIDCNGNHTNVNEIAGAWYEVVCRNYDHIYRSIETEIDEREEFIDVFNSHASTNGFICTPEFAGYMFDSGKFKLVD